MSGSEIVVADRLVKRFGPRAAVDGVSFSIREGEVIGLLGPNGSGKSTILRILCGFLPPSAGMARVAGLDVTKDSLAVRNVLGYVPEDAPIYDGMRVREFLHFMAEIKGVHGKAARAAVSIASERLDLGTVLDLPIGKLSRGYRQRAAIAQAILTDPLFLILDEPTNALDAYQVISVRELIRSQSGYRTVLVASHVLAEIERIASRVMILRNGQLLTADALHEDRTGRRIRLCVAGPLPDVLSQLRRVPGVIDAIPDTPSAAVPPLAEGTARYLVQVTQGSQVAAELAKAMIDRGFAVSELVEMTPDLERVFLDLTQRAAAAKALAA